MKIERSTIFIAGLTVAVLAAVAAGMWVAGSPGQARMERLDQRRVRDLQEVSRALERYRRTHRSLPEVLDRLVQARSEPGLRLADPETEAAYEYRLLGQNKYELCATFQAPREPEKGGDASQAFWRHEAGRTCFAFDLPPLADGR